MRCAGISRWSAGAWRRRQSPKGDPHETSSGNLFFTGRGAGPPQARPDPLGGSLAVPGERGVVITGHRAGPPQARPDPLGGSLAVPGERGVVMNASDRPVSGERRKGDRRGKRRRPVSDESFFGAVDVADDMQLGDEEVESRFDGGWIGAAANETDSRFLSRQARRI